MKDDFAESHKTEGSPVRMIFSEAKVTPKTETQLQ